jgi:hypothetical protein
MLDGDVSFERCLKDLCCVLNARLINVSKMKSDGDLYGVQHAVTVSVSVSMSFGCCG